MVAKKSHIIAIIILVGILTIVLTFTQNTLLKITGRTTDEVKPVLAGGMLNNQTNNPGTLPSRLRVFYPIKDAKQYIEIKEASVIFLDGGTSGFKKNEEITKGRENNSCITPKVYGSGEYVFLDAEGRQKFLTAIVRVSSQAEMLSYYGSIFAVCNFDIPIKKLFGEDAKAGEQRTVRYEITYEVNGNEQKVTKDVTFTKE